MSIATNFGNAISAAHHTDLFPEVLEAYSIGAAGMLSAPDKIILITFFDKSTAILVADRPDIEVYTFDPEDIGSIVDWVTQNPSYGRILDNLILHEIATGRLPLETFK